jgi:Na+-translocating ferredoxin:NAD+ oxidoreductase RNF subunit RnfB
MNGILAAAASLAVLAGLLVLLIYAVSRRFRVEADEAVEAVRVLLPGTNCGACGQPGCQEMAAALVGAARAGGFGFLHCPPGGDAVMRRIGQCLGVEAAAPPAQVAVLHCGGDRAASPARTTYAGPASCRLAHASWAGPGGCAWGCLGLGDCAAACPSDAIVMDAVRGLPWVDEGRCTGCGRCVRECPRGLFRLHGMGARVWVACRNTEKGPAARKACRSACIACGACQKTCASIAAAITVADNLAAIDPALCTTCCACLARCPTGAIRAAGGGP